MGAWRCQVSPMPTDKPVLLVFPFAYLSHYLRCLVLCRYLKEYYDIRFAFHPSYSAFVEREGYSSFQVDGLDEVGVLTSVKNFDFSWLNTEHLDAAFRSQVAAITAWEPLAVIGDACLTLKMAAEYTDVAYWSLLNGYMSKYYADTRYLSRTHPAYHYMMRLPKSLQLLLTRYGEAAALKAVHKPFKQLRLRYQLVPCSTYLDELEGDLNLICDLPFLFPQKVLPARYISLGPLIYEEPSQASVSGRLVAGKRTLFVTMGSTGDWKSMSFLNAPCYSRYNIVTAGDTQQVLQGSHIIRFDFVAASDVLPYTDLVICHGGNGTIYQALSYGVPVLCNPSHFEQEWNVAALEQSGLGQMLGAPSRIENQIELMLAAKEHPMYTEINTQIRKLSAGFNEKLAPLVNHSLSTVLVSK